MMSYIGEWISHIVLLILLATFFDLILPSSSMKKYVKLVVGLMIIMLILSPVLQVLRFDYDQLYLSLEELLHSPQAEEQILDQQNEIDRLQREAILEEAAASWERELKLSLQQSFSIIVHQVQVMLTPIGEQVQVEQLFLQVEAIQEKNQGEVIKDNEDTAVVVQPVIVDDVEPIRIDIGLNSSEMNEDKEMNNEERKIHEEVLSYLEHEWNISVDKIYFSWTRR